MNIRNLTDIKNILFNNNTVKQTLFKNTFWLSLSMSVNKLLGLILLIYAARILGATEYGKFNFALAFVSLFVIFHDFGLPTIITREFAREKEKKEDIYSILSLKILLGLGAFVLILLSSFFITPDPDIRKLILILVLFSLINGFITIFYAFFQARQKMEYQSWLEILQVLLIFSSGLYVLFKFPSVENLSYAYLFSALLALIFVLFFFHFKVFHLKVAWQKSVWRKFLIMSWPLALTGLFGLLYSYTDSVMLGYWGMLTETGWYNAAYKIVMATLIPMGLISGSFYPVLSKFFKESKEKLQKTWDYQLEIMIFLALPLMVGGIVLASKIIYFFYPSDFSPSVLAFQILILTAGLIFLNRPFNDVMIACNQQKKTFWITLFGALVNIILNLILIPKYSLYGAAVATVITYVLVLIMFLRYTMKFTPIRPFNLRFLSDFIVASFSAVLMYFIIIQPSIYNLNIFFSVIIGALAYLISLFILQKTIKPIFISYEKT